MLFNENQWTFTQSYIILYQHQSTLIYVRFVWIIFRSDFFNLKNGDNEILSYIIIIKHKVQYTATIYIQYSNTYIHININYWFVNLQIHKINYWYFSYRIIHHTYSTVYRYVFLCVCAGQVDCFRWRGEEGDQLYQ